MDSKKVRKQQYKRREGQSSEEGEKKKKRERKKRINKKQEKALTIYSVIISGLSPGRGSIDRVFSDG